MENSQNSTINEDKLKPNFADAKYATGKRKRSISRVWIKKGSGIIHVNGLKKEVYFKKQSLQTSITRPFFLSKRENEMP